MTRPVVLHFHLFKNAGTSVDVILKRNFGDAWGEVEGPNNKKLDSEPLVEFIRSHPNLKAISSHTAVVTLPKADDLNIIPMCFVRHPIDRIRSVYDFERVQEAKTPGAIQAKKGSFKEYVDWRLANPPSWQVKNFHAVRFKDFYEFTRPMQQELVEKRALRAVRNMPWLGLVEKFEQSMEAYALAIREHFPEFKIYQANANRTTNSQLSLQDNIEAFKDRVGIETYSELEEMNELDFRLYEIVKKRFHVSEATNTRQNIEI